ncbi:MAG: copper amine oxidase N-terminal domain-containing protein, partial [Defluviitaleaceae bacterium]|nr:copper amine oxidase N-terminal domain-containing protein [Defluviitaleaceae bacterium]
VADEKIAAAKEAKARSIEFSYQLYISGDVVSVVVYSTVSSASQKTEVSSVNFNPKDGSRVGVAEAVGYNIAPLAEKIIAERIRREPEKYSVSSVRLLPGQAYFMLDGLLVLLFDEYSLARGAFGVTPFAIDLVRVEAAEVASNEYYEISEYLIKMVPLQRILYSIGYHLEWYPREHRADIYKNGSLQMSLIISVNSYFAGASRPRRSLEAAPELTAEIVYVPISFFDQILSLVVYTIDEDRNITFYSYRD